MAPKPCPTDKCDDHSGLIMWMKINGAAGTILCGVLTYSVFFQAPDIKMMIAKETARIEADRKDSDAKTNTLEILELWQSKAELRITKLEDK